jgi:hypothetical protein
MTPESAWEAIDKYIPKDKIVWDPFYGNGQSGQILKKFSKEVIHTNTDFFTSNEGEIIISNPPYSLKKEVLIRLKEIDKPFILIMPSSTLITTYCRNLFKNDIQIIIPRKRIQFIKVDKDTKKAVEQSNHCNFDCFYFCYKLNLERDITYLD